VKEGRIPITLARYDFRVTPQVVRSSVGQFAFRETALGCRLELMVAYVHWALGLYRSPEVAMSALKNRKSAGIQIGALSRWESGEQAE
jgi:hypothetical protein